MRQKRILIIDDEQSLLESLEMFLTEKGYLVSCATSASEGLEMNSASHPDVIILDVRLPDKDGLEILEELQQKHTAKNIIIITAFHDMDTTIKAMKLGAMEYIPKPIDIEELEQAVERACKLGRAAREGDAISLDPSLTYEKGKIIGKSKVMKEIFKSIGILSENKVTVLIEGETGTGKELIARAIHYHSQNKDQPLLAINCSAIVGTLLESELFGHEKGAFTGAISTKRGKFELAEEGTIFLDEVSEIPIELQAKLLRFLQEKEFERVGGERCIKSYARVIAATNRDLWQMVKDGNFREDLYYRLSVASIKVPPLRERRSDIPLLIEYLLKKINSELHRNLKGVEEKAAARVMAYDWPGNVRELENILTRAAIATQGDVILDESMSPLVDKRGHKDKNKGDLSTIPSLQEVEKEHILKVLQHTNWHLAKTSDSLQISRSTLWRKIKEYEIVVRGESDEK
jgi:two-component system, NtrC family, response regulator AtoC